MLSQPLSRISKISPLMQMQRFRLFSSSVKEFPPHFIYGTTTSYPDREPGAIDFMFTSDHLEAAEEQRKVPCELLEPKGTVGASKGWVFTLENGLLCLRDDLKINASASNPKRISLPPLETLPHAQTQIVSSVAMSSACPDEDDDCIVAVKFLGPQLSLCRPAHDSKWTNIRITEPSFFTSPVMFSQRDGMFSLPASRGGYVGSWDLQGKPKLQKLRFQDLPRSRKKERELLDSCYSSHHLVESSSGESFLVLWYRTAIYDNKDDNLVTKRCMLFRGYEEGNAIYDIKDEDLGTKGFKVFRLDEEGNASYTEDIGDLCLCLSKSESFCVTASLFSGPDLLMNSISYIDVDESISPILDVGCFCLSRAERARENYSTYYKTPFPYLFPPQPCI